MRRAAAMCFLLLIVGWPLLCDAHKPSDSYLTLNQPADGTRIEGQWDIALRDLEHAVGLDVNEDGAITWGELKARREALTQYALSRLVVEVIARGERRACVLQPEALLFDEHVDGGYAVVRFFAECPVRAAGQLIVHYHLLFDVDPNHRGLLEVRSQGHNQAFVLSRDAPTLTLDLDSPDRLSQFYGFLIEGVWHIWTGYDHILFLLTLLIPTVVLYRNRQWEPRASLRDALVDVLKVVTAFTLAHSLTLTLAVNGWVSLPSRVVESAIALTVLLGALNNLFPVVFGRRWLVAFVFGLIHGLGFASVLADLGLHSWDLARALIGFNVGVEAGQLVIVLLFVPLAFALRATRFYRRAFMPVGATAISLVALYWLGIRIIGLSMQ